MEIFLKNKLLKRTVITLIILNFISIGAFIWKGFFATPIDTLNQQKSEDRDNQENKRDVLEILRKELDLTENQMEQMQKLREDFSRNEKKLKETIRSQRDSMNILMFNKNIDEEKVMTLVKRISENEYKMELMRLEQAKGFRTICTERQLEKFEDLVKEIRDYFKPDKPKNKKSTTNKSN